MVESFLAGGVWAAPLRYQIVEGEAGQRPEIAIALQASQSPILQFPQLALAGDNSAIIEMPGRQAGICKARSPADGALQTGGFLVSLGGGRVSV